MYIAKQTLDDLLREVFAYFLDDSQCHSVVQGRKGATRETFGALLTLTNPRARLSRSEMKGTPFSCLGEFSWYLSGDNQLDHIEYYLPRYGDFSDDGQTVYGAYGPRLFNMHGKFNQVERIVQFLRENNSSRRAVIQLFDAADQAKDGKDIPCTTNIQFAIRDNLLDMMVFMRSNDAYRGLPHDVFCFTMLQEILACRLKTDLGNYRHAVGSLHLYNNDFDNAKKFVDEGWHGTRSPMPAMPKDTIEADVDFFREAEAAVRRRDRKEGSLALSPYWKDLVFLLTAFRASKDCDISELSEMRRNLKGSIYSVYVEKLHHRLKEGVRKS